MINWYDSNPAGALKLKGSQLVGTTTLLSCFGFFLVGYGNAVFNGIINKGSFRKAFDNPDAVVVGFVTSIYVLGAFIGAVTTAFVGDKLGRRKSIALGAIIAITGCILQGFSINIIFMSIGRFVGGKGIGILSSSVPVLQAEISPQKKRGNLVAVYCTTLNLGILSATWINYILYDEDNNISWKLPILLPITMLILVLCLTLAICESPRWLLANDKDKDANTVLALMFNSFPDDPQVQNQFDLLKECVVIDRVEGEQSSFWKDFYNQDDLNSTRRLWSSIGIQLFQQLGGINILIFYSSILFEDSINLSPRDSSKMSVLLQGWLVAVSILPWNLIDRMGRKPLILVGISGQAITMGLQGFFLYKINEQRNESSWSWFAITNLFLFEASFTIGMQATVWVYCSEILPLRMRSKGTSLAASANYLSNSLLLQLAPVMLERIGWGTFIIFGELNLIFIPIIYYYFKETKGLSLEEIDELFVEN